MCAIPTFAACSEPICSASSPTDGADDHRRHRPRARDRPRHHRELGLGRGARRASLGARPRSTGSAPTSRSARPPEPPGEGEGPQAGGPLFEFDAGDGAAADGSTDLSQSVLLPARGATTFDASALDTALDVDGVEAATGHPRASPTSSSAGELPAPPGRGRRSAHHRGRRRAANTRFGGGAFDVNSFDVEGIPVDGAAVGPLTAAELVDGRGLESGDAGENVVVLDESWATAEGHAVGDTIDIGGEDFEVVGIVASTSADATTASDTYIPLDIAQRLADMDGPGHDHLRAGDERRLDRRDRSRPRGRAAGRHREHAGGPRLQRLRLAVVGGRAHREPRHLAVAHRAGGRVPDRDPVHDLGRHAAHPRVRHPQGDRLVQRPRRPSGRRRVARAGAARRRSRGGAGPARRARREPHRTDVHRIGIRHSGGRVRRQRRRAGWRAGGVRPVPTRSRPRPPRSCCTHPSPSASSSSRSAWPCSAASSPARSADGAHPGCGRPKRCGASA